MFVQFLVLLSLQLAFMPEYSLRRGAAVVWTVMSGLSGNGGGGLGVQNPLDNVSSPSTSGSSGALGELVITIAGGLRKFMVEVSKRLG